MPTDMVSLTVSTGLGVSVFAGILSGLVYVLTQGIKQRKQNRKKHQGYHCNICGDCLTSQNDVTKAVSCSRCGAFVCRQGCAYEKSQNYWICLACSKTVQSWYKNILDVIQPTTNKLFFNPLGMDKEKPEKIQLQNDEQKAQIREFIERLVATLLGETVDDACVSKMYNDDRYDSLVNRYHEDLSDCITELGSALHISMAHLPVRGQSPSTAHAALKQLIQRLIQEAVNLPALKEAPNQPPSENPNNEQEQRTYEDLLATAILNKVISSHQNGQSSSRNSSRMSTSSQNRDDKQYYFGEETLENKWKTTDLDTTSVSSLDDFIQSDSSLGSKKYVDRRTLTIKHNIEEVYQTDSENDENEEDDAEYFKNTNNLLAENDTNWYLQKRQFKSTASPVPVPMLVPNPTEDAKVLIGDKEVDDTSDLSDIGSDYGETEPPLAVNSLLVESKTVIGGRSPLESLENGWHEEPVDEELKHAQKTDITVDDDNVEDASILSIYSNTEKDTEYTEKYASLPRTIEVEASRKSDLEPEDVVEEDEIDNGLFNGNYSRKEREKWKNAIEMKNNPYTKENIEKRMQNKNSFGNLFGPDYYARQASKPSGSKLNQTISTSEVDEDEQFEQITHEAMPAIIIDDDNNDEEEEIQPEIKEKPMSEDETVDVNVYELTSDSDLSYINCYNVENAQISRIVKEDKEKDKEKEKVKEDHDENANVINETKTNTFIKNNSINSSRKFEPTPINKLNRSQSETDLISDYDLPVTIVAKKRDNTLISKIYKQANVRSFALSNRDYIPVDDNEVIPQHFRRTLSMEPILLRQTTERPRIKSTSSTEDNIELENSINDTLTQVYDNESINEQINKPTNDEIDAPKSVERSVKAKDPVINTLQEQKLVSNLKNQFSKSCIDLNTLEKPKNETKNKFFTTERKNKEDIQSRVSVRELMKIFEEKENNSKSADKPIYSLTARSLPKSTMEKLRN